MKTYSRRKNDEDSRKKDWDPFDSSPDKDKKPFYTSDEDELECFEKSNGILKNENDIEKAAGEKENMPGISTTHFYGSATKTSRFPFQPENRTPTRKKQSGLDKNWALSPKLKNSDNSGTEDLGGLYDYLNHSEEKVEDFKVWRRNLNRETDKRHERNEEMKEKHQQKKTEEERRHCELYEKRMQELLDRITHISATGGEAIPDETWVAGVYSIYTQPLQKTPPSTHFKTGKNEKLDKCLKNRKPSLNLSSPKIPHSKLSPFSQSPLSSLQKKLVSPEIPESNPITAGHRSGSDEETPFEPISTQSSEDLFDVSQESDDDLFESTWRQKGRLTSGDFETKDDDENPSETIAPTPTSTQSSEDLFDVSQDWKDESLNKHVLESDDDLFDSTPQNSPTKKTWRQKRRRLV